MNIGLLLDSSNTSLTVAISKDDVLLDSISYEAWQCQSEHMIPEIDYLFKKYRINKENIKYIIVSVGPGSYTGVRIAVSIAKVMGVCLDIPLYAVSSLQVLKNDAHPSICLINARSGRSYFGVYSGKKIIEKNQILTNEQVLDYINKHPDYTICGNTTYLNIDGYQTNIGKQLASLKDERFLVKDVLGLKPIYMKDC